MALDGKLLVIAGYTSDAFDGDTLPAVLEYNPEDHSWKELPSMLTVCYFCWVTVLGGDVVVLGCPGDSGVLEEVEGYRGRGVPWAVAVLGVNGQPAWSSLFYSAATVVQF